VRRSPKIMIAMELSCQPSEDCPPTKYCMCMQSLVRNWRQNGGGLFVRSIIAGYAPTQGWQLHNLMTDKREATAIQFQAFECGQVLQARQLPQSRIVCCRKSDQILHIPQKSSTSLWCNKFFGISIHHDSSFAAMYSIYGEVNLETRE